MAPSSHDHGHGCWPHDRESVGVPRRDLGRLWPLMHALATHLQVPLTRGMQAQMHRRRKVLSLHEQLGVLCARTYPPGVRPLVTNLDAELQMWTT
jgi:hypothetical protein